MQVENEGRKNISGFELDPFEKAANFNNYWAAIPAGGCVDFYQFYRQLYQNEQYHQLD